MLGAGTALIAAGVLACTAHTEPSAPEPTAYWRGVQVGTGGCPGGEQLRAAEAAGASARALANICLPIGTLSCTASVAFFGEAACEFVPSDTSVHVTEWEFFNPDFSATVSRPSSALTWSGPMVTSGTVRVHFENALYSDYREADIAVSRRSGWSWVNKVDGATGSLGEIDSCFIPAAVGATSGKDCSVTNKGWYFTPSTASGLVIVDQVQAGHGPNGGVYYVRANPPAAMHLRTQLARKFRVDGIPRYSMIGADQAVLNGCTSAFPGNPYADRNYHEVNTMCVPTGHDFGGFVSGIWAHEAYHMQIGVNEAKSSVNDLHKIVEPFVGTWSANVVSEVDFRAGQVRDRLYSAMLAIHGGPDIGHSCWGYVSYWRPATCWREAP